MVQTHLSSSLGLGNTTVVASMAGLMSGVPEAIIVTPFQVVKVRMQAKEYLSKYSSPTDCLSQTLRSEGPRALYIGLVPTLFRNCVWNTVYFGTMHWLKSVLPAQSDKVGDVCATLFSGFFGAVFATCFNAPFDVVKSRFQSQLHLIHNDATALNNITSTAKQNLKYTSTFQSLFLIYKEEGMWSMYKGFKPKAIRMGLGGAVAMATFDLVKSITFLSQIM